MKQFLKRFRVPLIIAGVLCLIAVGVLITLRAHAMRAGAGQDDAEPQTSVQTGSEAPEAPETPTVDEADMVDIVFSDGGVQTAADEDAVKAEGTDVTIRAAGTYRLSGSCENGSVKVKKDTKGVVLVLDGLNLTADGTAAISCNKGSEVTILAAEGSVNSLADTETNNDETAPSNENAENAVIKCKDGSQVLLCGTGTLNIQGNGKNGIKGGGSTDEAGEASLTISELTLNVDAVNDGIKSDSALSLCSGSITVSAADDAVGSDVSVTVGAEGTDGPTLQISDCTEGIEAPQVRILSGDVDVHARDDGLNAVSETGTADITIAGGTVFIDAEQGDGLDSNGTLNITGGDVRVFSSSRSDNSPLDYGTDMSITGGTVLAIGSSGMAEAPNLAAQTYVVFSAGNRIGGPQGGFGGGSSDAGSVSFTLQQGDRVQILDESGKVLAEAEAPRQADYVFFSSPELTDGQSCSLSINDQSVGTAAATSELSAFGGIPDVGGEGNQPQMPGGGDFDPNNLPNGGDFDPDNMPQMPDGDFDPNNMPQRPDGDFDPGNMPNGGDFDPDNMPQMPDGGTFDPGNRPQRPDGGQGFGRPGQGGADSQSGATSDNGTGKDA